MPTSAMFRFGMMTKAFSPSASITLSLLHLIDSYRAVSFRILNIIESDEKGLEKLWTLHIGLFSKSK